MTSPDDVVRALEPLLRHIGGEVVAPDDVRPDDIAVAWPGGPTVHVRLPQDHPLPPVAPSLAPPAADLSDGLARVIGEVERELGGPLATLPRRGKQRAVRLLEERGAFEMRRSAETVAEALGVTRFTVYNYLTRAGAGPA